jgi:hypothetical protein
MQTHAINPGLLPYLIPIAFIAIAILRNARARNLRIERLWIAPLFIAAAVALSFSQQHMPSPLFVGVDFAALVVGAALGWWRGRLTNITVNPETHALTSQTSPVGMLLILVIFALRYGIRIYAQQNASTLHASVNDVADAFLLLAVGVVCAQRLEIALRATRLLNEARSVNPA